MPDNDENIETKILEFKLGDTTTSVHVLKPGQHFERFGGSRCGLIVNKTPSLIVRQHSQWGTDDVEYDVHNLNVWRQIMDRYRLSIEEQIDA